MNTLQNPRILNSRENAKELLAITLESLIDDKGEDITQIDLEGKTDFAHFMVVVTGRSSRHVASMAEKLVDKLVAAGLDGVNMEGRDKSDWILIDANDVVIHLFRAEVREEYNIEKIWNLSPSN